MTKKKYLIIFMLAAIVFLSLLSCFLLLNIINSYTQQNQPMNTLSYPMKALSKTSDIKTITKELDSNTDYTFALDDNYILSEDSQLPSFIIVNSNQIKIIGTKYNSGTFNFTLINSQNLPVNYSIAISPPKIDLTPLEAQIREILGDNLDNYTIHFENLLNNQTLDINPDKIVEPASIAKLPTALLIMHDVDLGKITLDDTYPISDSKKFGTAGNLGDLTDGTPVTFQTYLEELLEHSDNNAWYMLVDYLGGSFGGANDRIINELGVNPLFLDPPQGTASAVSKVLKELYSPKILTKNSANYLISLLASADDWAKAAIGLGLPEGIRFVNKIGTLDDNGKISYQDAAIVWGLKSDYVLVIMDEKTDWEVGQATISEISTAVYNFLN